jgi:hypothetical protein
MDPLTIRESPTMVKLAPPAAGRSGGACNAKPSGGVPAEYRLPRLEPQGTLRAQGRL